MGALRIEVQAGRFNFGPDAAAGTEMDYLMLDSWKAELVIVAEKIPTLYMNGSQLQAGVVSPGSQQHQTYMLFGGLLLDGVPVNLNQRLEFSLNGGATDDDYTYVLTKTYLDPALADPSKR